MEFISRTAEEILEELKSLSESAESAVEGTFTHDVLAANAIEFQKIELELSEAYAAFFPQTSWEEYLTLRAEEHGVIRRAATKAVGILHVEGNGIISEGNFFSTEEGVRFVSLENAAIINEGEIRVEAVEAGSVGNVAAGTITRIPINIPGISSVTNEAATFDGYDEEDDETLRARLLEKVRHPATSGNPAEYVQWAMSISGVGAARCIRTPFGAGTVKVIIVDSNFEQANEELLFRVKEYIDSVRPVGILNGEIYVTSASPVAINISADVTTADAEKFREGINDYFSALVRKNFSEQNESTIVSAAKVGSLIITAGGDDYDYLSLRLNGEMADLSLSIEEFPVLNEIDFY